MTNLIKSTLFRNKIQVICILFLFPLILTAQNSGFKIPSIKPEPNAKTIKRANTTSIAPPVLPVVKRTPLPPKKQLVIEHSETLTFDAFVSPDYQILSGDVRFRHDGAYLYCDSAHYYQKSNSLYAYGNVHMQQGDSLFLYGAWLYYDGNTKLVMVREKVRLENRKVTLFTDSLNYDRISNIGYFFDGGLLVNEDKDVTNELSSEYGQYSPDTKMAEFKNDVKLVHPKFILTNQELKYNTESGVANIFCPTQIVSDSGYVYSESGWYDTKKDKSVLFKRSYILNNHRRLTGDTINYDRNNGIGESFGNVVLIDSTQQITIKGDYGYSEDKTSYALMSKRAVMIEHSTKDSLFLHADTLITRKDSIYNAVSAYHGVRFFRSDIQGVCDSLYYSTRDSILSFYHKPVLWSEQQQLSGDFIQLHTKNNEPDFLHIQKAAMVISQEADSFFNQSSGKDLKAYFDSSQVVRVEIKGNAEAIYLPLGNKKEISGLNRLEGSSLNMDFENKKMKKLWVGPQPKGKFYPLEKLPTDVRYLKNFVWYSDIRPKNPADIFREVKTILFQDTELPQGRQKGTASENKSDKIMPKKQIQRKTK